MKGYCLSSSLRASQTPPHFFVNFHWAANPGPLKILSNPNLAWAVSPVLPSSSAPSRSSQAPLRVRGGPGASLRRPEKSESGQYLAAKFSQRQGGLGVKITITTRVRSQKCEILVIATSPAFFLSNHDGIPLVKNTKISQNR